MQTKDKPSSDELKSPADGTPMTRNQQTINLQLSIIRRRMRLQSIFTRAARYLFRGLLLTSGMLLLGRLVRLPNMPSFVFLLPSALSAVLAIGLEFVRKESLSTVARFVDKRMNLKERFSTAVELMQRDETDDFSRLQIRDATIASAKISPSDVAPYSFPSALKWFPIPVILLAVFFAVPPMYELPLAPTAAEKKAIEQSAANLNRLIKDIDSPELGEKIRNAVKELNGADVHTVHDRLSKLRDEVRARQQPFTESEIEDVRKAFAEAGDESNRFKNMHPGALAEELEKLANEDNLAPELQEELQALFNQIAERLKNNRAAKNLTKELGELQTQTVDPDTLKRIARQLANIDKLAREREQLERALEQIAASRKNIALASLDIEMDRDSGGIANSEGGAGGESTTGETQGTLAAGDPDFTPQKTTEEAEFGDQPTATKPSQSLRTDAPQLTLNRAASDSESLSDTNVYVGNDAPSGEDEAEYIPYREVILNAKQEYAESIRNNRIPVRYRQLIGNYLEAITNP